MKKSSSDVKIERKDRQNKQHYEKPQFSSIALIANQVLDGCSSSDSLCSPPFNVSR